MRTKRDTDPKLTFIPSASAGQWSKTFEIHLLTPMVGGGTESWQVDREQPIRASEIKQQLRFWWRTTQNPTTPLSDLLKKEASLFGDTERASCVRLSVKQGKPAQDSQLLPIFIDGRNTDWKGCPGYVLFPLLGQKNARGRITNFTLLKEFSFTLTIACPLVQKTEVENALVIWLLFGGLGARTRRGAGSLWCPTVNDRYKSADEILAFVRSAAATVPAAVDAKTPPFPVLSGGRLVMKPIQQSNATSAWNALLGLGKDGRAKSPPGYGDLRQGKNLARSPGDARPGPTHWPEADALRTMSGTHSLSHKPRPNPGEWYPRAAYGLPLQFKFNCDENHRLEPPGFYDLQPMDSDGRTKMERWPSPLILKIARVGGLLFEMCLLFNQRVPEIYCKQDTRPRGIPPSAQPGAHAGKTLPPNFPIPIGHPHDGLLAKLFPDVTVHVI